MLRVSGSSSRSFVLPLVAVTVLLGPRLSQAETPPADEKLTAAIDALVEEEGISDEEPGVAVLIHQPGRLLIQRGYGLANCRTEAPITPQTTFELASVSKTFTATAVLMLHDRGKLSIDDDIRKYLPELPVYDARHPIRIRNLLGHTSGLPDYMDFEDVPARHETYNVNADYLGLFARDRKSFPLEFPTGEKYGYNNSNYMLLASLIERVEKRPYRRFLREEIFLPLGMTHSFLLDGPDAAPPVSHGSDHAVGYRWHSKKQIWRADWGVPPDRHPKMLTVGDGSIWTNLEDMLQWDLAVRCGKLLKPATWKLALTPSQTRDGETNAYGLGWQTYCEDSGELSGFGHDGSWGGFTTCYYRYLTTDRTTVLLSNRDNLDSDRLWNGIERIVDKRLAKTKTKKK